MEFPLIEYEEGSGVGKSSEEVHYIEMEGMVMGSELGGVENLGTGMKSSRQSNEKIKLVRCWM